MRRSVLLAMVAVLFSSAELRAASAEDRTFRRVAEKSHGRYYAARGQRVDVRRSEEFLARLSSLFGPAPAGWSVEYYRHATVADLQARIGFAAYGVTDVAAMRIDSVYDFHPHELVHAVAGRVGQPPLLFSEGLAVALTARGRWREREVDDVARQYLAEGGSLDRLLRTFGEQADRDYAVAGSFVAFLLDGAGIEPLVAFLAGCGNDAGRYQPALRAAYGRGLADLEYEWGRRLRQPSTSRPWYEASSWPGSLRGRDVTAAIEAVALAPAPPARSARSEAALEPAATGRD